MTPNIPGPGFAGDLGDPDPALVAALAAYADASPPTAEQGQAVFAALREARLLVPIVAVLESVGADGAEKDSAMATVLVEGGAGRRALLAFTGVAALRAWRADARPSPVGAPAAARSALAESADTLLVDPAGPVAFAVGGADLRALAVSDAAAASIPADAVAAVVRSCLRHVPEVASAAVVGTDGGPPRLVIGVVPGLDQPALEQVVIGVSAALSEDLAVRCVLPDGVQVAVISEPEADTPGS